MKLVSQDDLNHRYCFEWLAIWTSAMFGFQYTNELKESYLLDAAAELMAEGRCLLFRTDGLGGVIQHKALPLPGEETI